MTKTNPTMKEIRDIKVSIKKSLENMVKNCRAFELNICEECPSKKECCELAYGAGWPSNHTITRAR